MPLALLPRCEQFVSERKWVLNLSPKTIEWHRQSLCLLTKESPSQQDINDLIVRLRQAGQSPSTVNCRARSINAYLRWSGARNADGLGVRMPRMKEPEFVPSTYTSDQVDRIMKWKPQTAAQRRLHTLLIVMLGTGLRVDEVLSLRLRDVNLDDLLLTVSCGKGGRGRIVPFDFDVRRALARFVIALGYCSPGSQSDGNRFVFATAIGRKMGQRNVLRNTRALCKLLGFDPPRRCLHSFRHTFAMSFVRAGGDPFRLRAILGHSSLTMTLRYVNLCAADLRTVRLPVVRH